MILKSLNLAGLKSIRDMQLELKALNVLIGANGAGKSNLISFFRLLNCMMNGNLQGYVGLQGGADSLLHYGSKQTPRIKAELTFKTTAGLHSYEFQLSAAVNDTLIFTEEFVGLSKANNKEKLHKVSLDAGHKESELLSYEGLLQWSHNKLPQGKAPIHAILESWRVYHFHDTSAEAKVKKQGYVEDNQYLRDDAGNLAAFLYAMKQTHLKHYRRIIQVLQQVAPFFGDFVLEPSRLNSNYITLNWKERDTGKDTIFGPHQLSDGTLRMAALVTLLLQPQLPELIVVDEPELGLHPYALGVLASLLQSVSQKTQLLVSTQSAALLNYLEPQDVIVVEREKGQSVFRRLDEQDLIQWLEEYSLGELWDKNVFGGRPAR